MTQTTTLAEFARQTGDVYVAAAIHWDFSDYVKATKADLLDRLRANKISHVEWSKAPGRYGDITYIGGYQEGDLPDLPEDETRTPIGAKHARRFGAFGPPEETP